MATEEGKVAPVLMAAEVALAARLIAKLEGAHRNGTLKPINPNAKSVAMDIRVQRKEMGND